jgi:hypothetical protein
MQSMLNNVGNIKTYVQYSANDPVVYAFYVVEGRQGGRGAGAAVPRAHGERQ